MTLILKEARGGAIAWGTALQVGRSRVRLPIVLLKFSIDIILPDELPGNKGGRGVQLTILPPACAKRLEIWEPQPPETFWAPNGPVQGLLCCFDWHWYWRNFRFLDDRHELHHGKEKSSVSMIQTCMCVPYIVCLNNPCVPFIVSPSTATFYAFAWISPESRGSSGHDKRDTFYLSSLSLPSGQITLFISFSSLSYDRSKASSKASSPHSAIQSFLFQMRVSSPFLKVIQ